MSRMLRFAALILCVVGVLSEQQLEESCGQPVSQPSNIYTPGSRIVNGKVIQEQSWPWLTAFIQYKPEQQQIYQFCGGAVISKRWILSAGHCFDSASQEEMTRTVKALIGSRNLLKAIKAKGLGVLSDIDKVIVHPQYDQPQGSTNYDMALIRLKKPLTFSADIRPVCLPNAFINQTTSLKNNANGRPVLFVAGWGHQYENQQQTADGPVIGAGSDDAKQVDIEMYTANECKNKMRGYYFSDYMNCGGFDQGGKDSCQGDSGGPLIQKQMSDGKWVQQGVVSWGAGCAEAGKPGIYTNVRALLPWLQKTIKENS